MVLVSAPNISLTVVNITHFILLIIDNIKLHISQKANLPLWPNEA